ncbi:MAG: hypothetical protein J6J42_08730 [Lachnospiraceae bacterium]|nr:hypothetical protein [Lachnospiraceae bacterium]
MEELSRIIIEEFCKSHDSAKSRRLYRLVRMSYDIDAEYTDDDGLFIEKLIEREKDAELKEALQDLDEFMFGY